MNKPNVVHIMKKPIAQVHGANTHPSRDLKIHRLFLTKKSHSDLLDGRGRTPQLEKSHRNMTKK